MTGLRAWTDVNWEVLSVGDYDLVGQALCPAAFAGDEAIKGQHWEGKQ